MTGDPFGHGMPVGDYHSWVKPTGEPCPYCECCTKALCRVAVEQLSACHLRGGSSSYELVECPCWRRSSPERALIVADLAAAALDRSEDGAR